MLPWHSVSTRIGRLVPPKLTDFLNFSAIEGEDALAASQSSSSKYACQWQRSRRPGQAAFLAITMDGRVVLEADVLAEIGFPEVYSCLRRMILPKRRLFPKGRILLLQPFRHGGVEGELPAGRVEYPLRLHIETIDPVT